MLNIEWLDVIVALAIMTPAFFMYSEKIPQILSETKKEKGEQRQEPERVKCQCGYEYEGNKIPSNCPQCGKKLT